ncbi:MAG TPA: ACT domain-containing protein, partial [Spirochaetia bacterium]|nr:ACT domain-containing protein [Spirochaetia bacterium]
LSADPSSVKNAFVIPELSYQEAMELSYFGAEVIHPYTMIPAVENGIPIRIKNTFHPGSPGTLISAAASPKGTPITGIASIEHVALVNVEGGGMIGIPGFAARIFGALARHSISIIMISQASSEHSICLVFQEDLVDKVRETLRGELETELRTKRIQEFEIMGRLVIVAVIGENMRGTPGISGRLFSALGKEGINVLAIAQGSSERNISLVISAADKGKALRSIHRAFLESEEGV